MKKRILIAILILCLISVAYARRYDFSKLITEITNAVGIGTNTPSALLDVGGGSATSIDGTDDLLVKDDAEIDDDLFVTDDTTIGGNISIGETAYFDAEYDNGNSSTADTINWRLGNKQKSTLTDDCTFTFTEPVGACSLILKLVQDGTGSRTVTWPADVLWPNNTAPTLTTTATYVDLITFYYDGIDFYGLAGFDFR